MQIEWIILADSAQVVDGKLYVLGGGWKTLTVTSDFPVVHQMGLALSFEVPWGETNMPQTSRIAIQTADGREIMKIDVQFEVGRPPGVPAGPQRFQFAANFGLQFEEPGTYVIVGSVEGQEDRRVDFHVVPGPKVPRQKREDV